MSNIENSNAAKTYAKQKQVELSQISVTVNKDRENNIFKNLLQQVKHVCCGVKSNSNRIIIFNLRLYNTGNSWKSIQKYIQRNIFGSASGLA
jgi:hypothetical protein